MIAALVGMLIIFGFAFFVGGIGYLLACAASNEPVFQRMSNPAVVILRRYKTIPQDDRPETYKALKRKLQALDAAHGIPEVNAGHRVHFAENNIRRNHSERTLTTNDYVELWKSVVLLQDAIAERKVRGVDVKGISNSIRTQAGIITETTEEFM